MHSAYKHHSIKGLRDHVVRYFDRGDLVALGVRAELLLYEIDAGKSYAFEVVAHRILGNASSFLYDQRIASPELLDGEQLQADLRLLIEDVSDIASIPVEKAGERVYTVDELSERFNVATKTLSRWRREGLVSRRFVFGGRKRIGFLESSVQHFVSANRERVARGERFSQLSDAEKGQIVQLARQLARTGICPSEVTRQIAAQIGRSIETIRYTLKHFDAAHPDLAIFPDKNTPLSEEQKVKIFRQFVEGASLEDLAKRHRRSPAMIERIVNEVRCQQILELPLDYIPNECFDDPRMEAEIMGKMPEVEGGRKARVPSGLPPYLASLYEVPLLNRDQEYHLFRQFNYLKCKASKLRGGLHPSSARPEIMDQIDQLFAEATAIKNRIVQANLRLVVSIAKRHVGQTDEFFSLVSDGNMSLIRAVEKFDYSRGNKFSTYASWAIMKNFARTIPHEFRQRDRFRTSSEELFQAAEDSRPVPYEQEAEQKNRETQIGRIMSRLDDREQKIIISRFGLDHSLEPKTLKEVGADLGVTKERIRQIEARALSKLRLAASEEKIELAD